MGRETMSSRERFHATYQYRDRDRAFRAPHGGYKSTRARWHREGLPVSEHWRSYFGFDRIAQVPLNPGYTEDLDAVWPRPETRIVERGPEKQIVENELGGRYMEWWDRDIGMSQWIEFPVRDRESWERFKAWLNPDQASRYPEYWDDVIRCYKGRDYPLGISIGSFYGWIRDWVGMENLAFWYYDCPDLVHDMVDYVADFIIRWIDKALTDIPDLDFATIWEDMCMKTGPLISPKLFREFHLDALKKVTKVVKEAGVKLIMLDSDGRVDELIPLWMEGGVDQINPLEVASGCDPIRYRREFGKTLRMGGGIDKRVLRDGMTKRDIEDEVMRYADLVQEGGFVPSVDHGVPPDVPFENFTYYIGLLHEIGASRRSPA